MSFAKNISNKYGKKLLDTATKTELDASKTASKKVVHKTTEAGELIGNKIAENQNLYLMSIYKMYYKMEHNKIYKLL